MTTTEALKSSAGALAETAAGAVSELADKAKAQAETVVGEAKDRLAERTESHRGRTLLIGAALVGAAAAAFRFLRGRLGGSQERVIDLTQDPVVAPETLPTS